MFKDLKQGFQVSLLDKSGEFPQYHIGTIVGVSEPRIDQMKQPPFGQPMSYADRVIDLTVEFDGKTQTYTVPEQSNLASVAALTLSCTMEPIANELRAILKHSEGIVQSAPHHEEVIVKVKSILEELQPAPADSKRLAQLEGKMDKMEGLLEKLVALNMPKSKTKGE